MGIFSKNKKQFKKIEDFDSNKPIKDLFDMYINSIDSSWDLDTSAWNFTLSKINSGNKAIINFGYSFDGNGNMTFSKSITIRIIPNIGSSDTISLDYDISNSLKNMLYQAYVKYKTTENNKKQIEADKQIQKFKSPFEKELTRDNKLKKLFNQ